MPVRTIIGETDPVFPSGCRPSDIKKTILKDGHAGQADACKRGAKNDRGQILDIAEVINQSPVSRLQYRVFILCFAVSLLDGFDMYILPYAAPAVLRDFQISRSLLGSLISAGLIGMTVSGLIGGMLADKLGRRSVIVSSIFIFGVATLAKGFIGSYTALLLLQIASGFGLGGAYMNVMALTAEYAPLRVRRFAVTCVSCAYPLGGILAGYATAVIIPLAGWRSTFVLGGAVALLIFVACYFSLPHSVRQLVLMRHSPQRVQAIMRIIAPAIIEPTPWTSTEQDLGGLPISDIFRQGRASLTCLLALAMLISLMTGYFITSWSPTLLNESGIPLSKAIVASTMGQAGSVAGALLWGRLIDRVWPPAIFAAAAILAAVFYSLIGHAIFLYPLLLVVFFVGGLGTGVTSAYNGFTTSVYPTPMRGTALGFILGVGRVGAIVGPLVGGLLLGAHWPVTQMYYVPASALIIVVICMLLLSFLKASRTIVSSSRPSAA
ncbi:MFS transporter [Paraburkholderia caffeinilytica]|uniref:MFS transporter n=1 Tax=Paraburkholderia caffeinilytica TaxID=1761016 RepID=UPI0038BA5FBC